ncbi:hypothetical protein JCM10213_006676 [Rhodosporidiobolus nylandii]
MFRLSLSLRALSLPVRLRALPRPTSQHHPLSSSASTARLSPARYADQAPGQVDLPCMDSIEAALLKGEEAGTPIPLMPDTYLSQATTADQDPLQPPDSSPSFFTVSHPSTHHDGGPKSGEVAAQ